MTTTPKTGAPELAESQADKEETVNEGLRRIEVGAGLFRIEDNDATAPPGSCADGGCYIPAATATGAWAGKEKNIAIAVGVNAANGWYFIAPEEGMRAWVKDEDAEFAYNGSAWVAYTAAPSGTGTAATLDFDTDGTLAANSDAKIATQKAAKTYVDGKVAGLSWKQAVRVATTGAGTLASSFENGDTIDGVTLATGDRILIKNQSSGAENGIYIVAASGAPSRATDADSGAELVNASVYVSEGTANADTQWVCTTNATITVGSTALTFAQFGAGTVSTGAITGSGLTMATARLLGRTTASTGAVEEISVGQGLSLASGVLKVADASFRRTVEILVSDPAGSAITTGDGKAYFRVPETLDGLNLVAVGAAVTTVSSSGIPTVQIANVTDSVDMLSTKLTIDANETDSSTAAAAAVIDGAHDDVATADMLRIDIDVAGTGAKGLIVSLTFG